MCTLSRETINRATDALRNEGLGSPVVADNAHGAIRVTVEFNGHNYSHVITAEDMKRAYGQALQGK